MRSLEPDLPAVLDLTKKGRLTWEKQTGPLGDLGNVYQAVNFDTRWLVLDDADDGGPSIAEYYEDPDALDYVALIPEGMSLMDYMNDLDKQRFTELLGIIRQG